MPNLNGRSYCVELFGRRIKGAQKMTPTQLNAIREALEAARNDLKQLQRGRAVEEGLLKTIAKVEKAIVELDEALTAPDGELQLCDLCKKVYRYNGDWYCGLCPRCADETEDSNAW